MSQPIAKIPDTAQTWSGARSRIAQRQMQIAAEPRERRAEAFKELAQLASNFVREGLISEVEARETLEDVSERVGLVEDTTEGVVAIIINEAMRRAHALLDPERRHDAACEKKAAFIERRHGLRHDAVRRFAAPRAVNGGSAEKQTVLEFSCMADIAPRQIEWIWPGRIARGKLTLLIGDPGVGKSQISLDMAATVTNKRRWTDDGSAPPGSVILLSAEDSADDTLRPRLEAADADLHKVHVLQSVLSDHGRSIFSLQTDLDALGKKIEELGDVSLVIIDPITSYMGGKIDSHRTTDVRSVLEPLALFASKHNVAVLGITHPPKAAQTKAIHSATGSLAYIAAARLAFLAIEEPGTDRRLFLPIKNNLGALAPGLGFRLQQTIVTGNIVASHVMWDCAPVTMTANEVLAATGEGKSVSICEALDFLREELAEGPRPAKEIKEAAKCAGVAWRTVQRAQKQLQIKPSKNGLAGGWSWALPPEGRQHVPD